RLASALAPAVLGVLVHPVRDTRGFSTVGADDHHLPKPEWHGLLDDPALLVLRRVGLGVVLGDVHPGDDHGLIARPHFLHAAALAPVLAGDHHDFVALAKAHATSHLKDLLNLAASPRRLAHGWLDSLGPAKPGLAHAHRTSGASETIFMKLRSRSSRATGPKMRVARGWFCGFRRTAALSSNRIIEPSVRRYSLVCRTTTARTTSPFLTPEFGMAFFTVATKTSPISAVVPDDERRTRITESSRAPVLAAHRTLVYGRITLSPAPLPLPSLRARVRGSRQPLRPPRAPSRCLRHAGPRRPPRLHARSPRPAANALWR